jgi:uncharacterized protein (DUF433 family)
MRRHGVAGDRGRERGVDFTAGAGYTAAMITLEHAPVASSNRVLGGTLVFRGTRVPAQTLLDYQNDGFSLDEFLAFFPSVDKDDASAFLETTGHAHHF